MSMWRERGERNGERGEENGKRGGKGRTRAREEQKREEGASSPFYSESGIPGCCQVTVGQSLDRMLTMSILFYSKCCRTYTPLYFSLIGFGFVFCLETNSHCAT